jgi:serine/threonine protein kinase
MLDTIRVTASHLPDVTDHILDYTATRSTDYSTSHIRERLGLNTKGARKLTIVVFEELDGDISRLDGIEMWEVAYQIDKCGYFFCSFLCSLSRSDAPGNRALWKLGIQHRDISPPNIMFRRIDGRIRGYLIDFDLASLAGRDPHNLDRIGTMPFMAVELLRSGGVRRAPVLHTYAHDAEAVCWVLLWLGVQYAAGKRVNHSFDEWEMVDARTCYRTKFSLLGDLYLYPFTKPNEVLQEPIQDLLAKFRLQYFQQILTGETPIPYVDEWMEECDKSIRAQVSSTS